MKKIAKRKNASDEDKRNFHQVLRYYNFVLKESKKQTQQNKMVQHGKKFKKDFWKFAKKACLGTIDQEEIKPAFKINTANEFYSAKYSTPKLFDVTK